ncbi:MAG TPA: hypothetical protein VEI02_01500 [Planctomycetota bacterium]|nr:hypothetical protein [Planctomycetota bacterium]
MIRSRTLVALLAAALVGAGCRTAHREAEVKTQEASSEAKSHPHAKPGFVVFTADDEGRLWVFKKDAPALTEFAKSKELAKYVSAIGEGPGGVTLKAPDRETIDAYRKACGLE